MLLDMNRVLNTLPTKHTVDQFIAESFVYLSGKIRNPDNEYEYDAMLRYQHELIAFYLKTRYKQYTKRYLSTQINKYRAVFAYDYISMYIRAVESNSTLLFSFDGVSYYLTKQNRLIITNRLYSRVGNYNYNY
jgi:hypothetical protein